MQGEIGNAVTAIHGGGTVFVHGEYWDAVSTEPIAAGTTVEVVGMAPRMRLQVKAVDKAAGEAPIPPQQHNEPEETDRSSNATMN